MKNMTFGNLKAVMLLGRQIYRWSGLGENKVVQNKLSSRNKDHYQNGKIT